MYVDRNANSDLTEPGERVNLEHFFLSEPVVIVAGKAEYRITSLHPMPGDRNHVSVESDGRRLEYAGLKPAKRLQDAPRAHFDGPLAMALSQLDPADQRLKRAKAPCDFCVMITTAGPKQEGCWGPVINHAKHVPPDVHPVAEFEFAPKKAGAKPVRLRVILTER